MPRQNRRKRLKPEEKRTRQVNAYVYPGLKEALQDYAEKRDKSESDVVQEALEHYFIEKKVKVAT